MNKSFVYRTMKKYLVVLISAVLLQACIEIEPFIEPPPPANDFKVMPIYVIPADRDYLGDNATRVWRSAYAMQNWFQTATGGLTFELLDPDNVFEIYGSDFAVDYYQNQGWDKLIEELQFKGYPVETAGTLSIIFVQGADSPVSEDLGFSRSGCDGDCGTALLPISTLQAPTRLPVNMGPVFHEIGHALGLVDAISQSDLPLSAEEEVALYSVMCEAELRAGTTNTEHGFLTSEKAALAQNPFMKENVFTYQDIWSSRIINYPELGEVPTPEINHEVLPGATVQFSSNIEDGLLYYWYFGDGSVSTEKNPQHTFNNYGLYNVTLMVTTADYMAARTSAYINLN